MKSAPLKKKLKISEVSLGSRPGFLAGNQGKLLKISVF